MKCDDYQVQVAFNHAPGSRRTHCQCHWQRWWWCASGSWSQWRLTLTRTRSFRTGVRSQPTFDNDDNNINETLILEHPSKSIACQHFLPYQPWKLEFLWRSSGLWSSAFTRPSSPMFSPSSLATSRKSIACGRSYQLYTLHTMHSCHGGRMKRQCRCTLARQRS